MSTKRRKFDNSLELKIVQLTKDQGLSIRQVCLDMNLCETAIRLSLK